MDTELDRKRLEQTDFLDSFIRNHSVTDMITVYSDTESPCYNRFIFSALIPLKEKETVLSHRDWDLQAEFCFPQATYSQKNDEIQYSRFGNDNGFEPLVICRRFHDMKDSCIELTEEFRFFHNLYYDPVIKSYLKFDDAGNSDTVAVISADNVKIRTKELRQFLAVKNMFLSIQFDCREYSECTLEELNLEKNSGRDYNDENTIYSLCHDGPLLKNIESFSIVMGKHLILPLPKNRSGIYGTHSEAEKQYCDFIIGSAEDGDPIRYTANPEFLANFFGKNPTAPNFLTPVHFSKDVLDKYYQHPSKYTVEHGVLRCGSLWLLQFDNDCADKIVVWLGDLGKSLPYQEQLHWQSHNIPPVGEKISDNYFKSQLMAEPVESKAPVPLFLNSYNKLRKKSIAILGWPIILPLTSLDTHYLQTIRIPASDEQKEFDELVLGLTKTVIDSLNEKELRKYLSPAENSSVKGSISILETVLNSRHIQGLEHIKFLRDLQDLRSASSAHRKGMTYEKIAKKFELKVKNSQTVFEEILRNTHKFMDFLAENLTLLR